MNIKMMQKIELTPNQNLMSPLDQCHSLGLIQTPQEIESNNNLNSINKRPIIG